MLYLQRHESEVHEDTRTGDPREGAEAREAGTEAGAEYEAEADLETVTGPDVNNGDWPLPLDQVS